MSSCCTTSPSCRCLAERCWPETHWSAGIGRGTALLLAALGARVVAQGRDAARLGKDRVRIIAEAFRPAQNGVFRAATAAELSPQLLAYRGYRTYLFDGPHYVSDQLVQDLLGMQQAQK